MKKKLTYIIPSLMLIITAVTATVYYTSNNNSTTSTGALDKYDETSESDIDVANKIQELIHTDGKGNIRFQEDLFAEYAKLKKSSRASVRTSDLDWVERGPGNVGGRMRTLLVDANDPTGATWFAGAASGGIWKTENNGFDWENKSESKPHLSIVTIAQSPANPDIIYAGSGEGALGGSFYNGIGIFKSEDAGETWQLLESTTGSNFIDFQNVNRIIVNPDNANDVIAATSNGVGGQEFRSAVLRSYDGGLTWTKIFEPNARAQQIIADPTNFDRLYVSVIFLGVYVSEDGGQTWTQSDLDQVVQAAGGATERTELAIAQNNTDIIYASVGYESRSGSGLFLSVNAGLNWINVSNEEDGLEDYLEQGEYDNCIVVNPLNDLEVFWGGVNLYRAEVDLETTVAAGRGFLGVDQIDTESFLSFVNFNNGTHFNNQLAINDDTSTPNIEIRFGNGASQKAHRFTVPPGSTAGVPDEDYSYQDYVDVPFEVWDIDDNRQIMVSFRDQENDGVFNLNERLPDDENLAANREYIYLHDITYAETPDASITVNGGQEVSQYLFAWPTLTPGGVWSSGNLPNSTFRIKFGEIVFQNAQIIPLSTDVHVDHHYLVALPLNETDIRVITVNDGGVAFTRNKGLSFATVETGLNTSQFYAATKKPGERFYFGGTQDNGVLLSTENAQANSVYSEENAPNIFADGFDVIWSRIDQQKIIASHQNNIIYRSTNGGESWIRATNSLTDAGFGNINAPFFTKLAAHPRSNQVYAVSASGVWSSDFGEIWDLTRLNDNDQWGGFLDIEVSPFDENIVWAGGGMSENRNIFVSTDGGESFSEVQKFGDLGNITSIVPSLLDANTAYLVFSQVNSPKILKTTDLGQTWTELSGFNIDDEISSRGFPNVAVYCLLEFPDGEQIWAGTEIGIVESLDNGQTWNLLDSSLPSVPIWDMRVLDGEIVTATYGRGIWTLDMGLEYEVLITSLEDRVEANVTFYPNPAKNFVSIENLRYSKALTVSVYNTNGQRVLETSAKDNNIDISTLKNGMYVMTVQSDLVQSPITLKFVKE